MRIERLATTMIVLAVAACNQTDPQQQAAANEANQPAPEPPSPPVANETANVSLPDDRTPLEEPKGPIDPKSAEAAGQAVQHYGALIEQGRWSESRKLWSSADAAKHSIATGATIPKCTWRSASPATWRAPRDPAM